METSVNKIRIDLDKSIGSYVFDKNTKEYFLDFMSMFSSLPLGYNHPIFESKKFKTEVEGVSKVRITNCEYLSDERDEFEKSFEEFCSLGKYSNFHFCCTGALSIEWALKMAFLYKKETKPIVVSIKNSFHGISSFGNFVTSRTGSTYNRLDGYPWEQMWPKISSIEELNELIEKGGVTAVIVEPIQCTSGDIYLKKEFLQQIRDVTLQHDIPLIFDEIQTGFGATGKIWYFEHLGIEPDIVCFGKKSQVSGIMVKKEFSEGFKYPQKFCITWDGDVIDMVRAKFIIQAIKRKNLLLNVKNQGEKIEKELKKFKLFKEVRGIGVLWALEFFNKEDRDKFHQNALKNNLILNMSGENFIRMRPNLSVSNEEINHAIDIIKKSAW